MEDAEAEGGEGAFLDGVVCFAGQAEGEEGGDGEVEKDFAGDFWWEGSEVHNELDDRSLSRCRERRDCKDVLCLIYSLVVVDSL